MPLENRIVPIPAMTVTTPGGGAAAFHIACHQAVSYWLYEEANGFSADGDHYTYNSNLTDISNTMTKLTYQGSLLRNAGQPNALPNGTVLIFTDATRQAAHSCVLDNNGDIGGYNQLGWFPGGANHNFSTHPKTDVQWRAGIQNCVRLNQGQKGRLYAVPEAKAVLFAKYNF